MRFHFLFLPILGLGTPLAKCQEKVPPSSARFWFSQPIDHFGLNDNTWSQQYSMNATFYQPGGPIYIVTPGETPLASSYTDKTHFTALAQKTNGMVVAIEHRFYGKSNPMPDLSGSSLIYHTVDNVLEDFAAFIWAAKTDPPSVFPFYVSPNSKVVFGGGSYAGSIAAWMRAVYPELVSGAWASSALLQYRFLNYQLDQSWGKHLKALGCDVDMAQAVKDMDSILMSGNITAIKDIQSRFGSPELTPRDFAGLLSVLAPVAAMAPSYQGFDYTQATVCSFFNHKQSPLDSYAAVVKNAIGMLGYTKDYMSEIANTAANIDNYSLGQSGRVWYYQECAWYGDWQVASSSSTGLPYYRSQLVDLTYFQPNCKRKFGDRIKVPVDSASFNSEWFDKLKGLSNVYYSVGALDIWRGSSVVPWDGLVLPNTTESPIFIINNATHAQDLRIAAVNDLVGVTEARRLGDAQVLKWIS